MSWTGERPAKRNQHSPDIQKTPPHSDEAEQGVLGSMMDAQIGAVAMAEARSAIDESYFYVPAHCTIFNAMCAMRNEGSAIDLITLTQFLKDNGQLDDVGGAHFVTSLANFVPTAAHIAYYLDIVREKYLLRQIIDTATESVRRAYEEESEPASVLDWIEPKLTSLRSLQGKNAEVLWGDALAKSVVTVPELHALQLTPRQKLLGDWFSEGDCGFIFAFKGTGKTWLAVAMANALATGGKLGDWQAHAPVKVLYIDSEMPADLMRERCNGLGDSPNLHLLNHDILFDRTGKVLNIADGEIQSAITKQCINSGIKVLFIDNLSTAAFGMKENEADSWELVLPWLLDLRRRKVAVVIVHHAGRSGQMRGTSKREDAVFWIIALDDRKKDADDKRGARFISRFTKPSRNTQEELPAFEWHFVTDTKTGEVTIGHKQARTLDVFRSWIESGVNKCDEIAEAMNMKKYEVSRMAKKGEDEGWLTRPTRGEYGIKKEADK
jgi:putative DNA primase/helicase